MGEEERSQFVGALVQPLSHLCVSSSYEGGRYEYTNEKVVLPGDPPYGSFSPGPVSFRKKE